MKGRSNILKGAEPAKVGTVPMLIIRDSRTPLKVGAVIRFRNAMHGSKWERGIVDRLDPRLFITRM